MTGDGSAWLGLLTLTAAATIVLGLVHPVAYTLPGLRAIVEGVTTLMALAAAALVAGQFESTRRARTLLVFGGLMTLALTGLFANTLPAALGLRSGGGFTALQPLGDLVAAASLVAAALTGPRTLVRGGWRRPVATTAAWSACALGASELVGLLFGHQLLADPRYSRAGIELALRHPAGLIVWLGASALFLYAGYEFRSQPQRDRDPARLMFAGFAVLLGASHLYYLTMPRIGPEAVSLRDALRLAAFMLLVGAVLYRGLDIQKSRRRAAALAERRRVAQDLHDGLVQDLALIAAYGGRLAEQPSSLEVVALAARRALAVSRQTIDDLSDLSSDPPQDALDAIAYEFQDRLGISVAVDVDPGTRLAPETQDHVVRITREAIANAARHGGARSVAVSLRQTEVGNLLRVSDDGRGIGPGLTRDGFGLRCMRERAAALGGRLAVRQWRKSGGTELELTFP